MILHDDREERSFGFTMPVLSAGPGATSVIGAVAGTTNPFGLLYEGFMTLVNLFNSSRYRTCNDPFTGQPLMGDAACNAADWRKKCADPAYQKVHQDECGTHPFDPHYINCPPGSSASDLNPFGTPTGRCVCDLSVWSKSEAIQMGCDLSAVWKLAPVGLILLGTVMIVKGS